MTAVLSLDPLQVFVSTYWGDALNIERESAAAKRLILYTVHAVHWELNISVNTLCTIHNRDTSSPNAKLKCIRASVIQLQFRLCQ